MTVAAQTGLRQLDLNASIPYEQALTFRESNRLIERIQDLTLAVAGACYRQGCPPLLPLSLGLARDLLLQLQAQLRQASSGTLPPAYDWQAIVSAIRGFDQDKLTALTTKLTQSPFSQLLPQVKWDDEIAPLTTTSTTPKEK